MINMFPMIAMIGRVASTLLKYRTRLEADLPQWVAYIDEIVAVTQKHLPKLLTTEQADLMIVKEILDDLKK